SAAPSGDAKSRRLGPHIFPTSRSEPDGHDCSIHQRRRAYFNSLLGVRSKLVQDAGVMADQGISYGGGLTSEPELQPSAEPMAECARSFFKKSFRQIDSA